jgi:hypothetical protein
LILGAQRGYVAPGWMVVTEAAVTCQALIACVAHWWLWSAALMLVALLASSRKTLSIRAAALMTVLIPTAVVAVVTVTC